MSQYAIHEENIEKLMEKLHKIEKKCSKYGCTFNFTEIGEEYREIKQQDGEKTLQRFVLVDVDGKAIINDWQFIATLEHTENGNIIRNISGLDLPKKYLTVKPICEHCKSDRNRKDTYVIRNTISGEFKQVGKSCLRDYTNGMDAQLVADYLSYFDSVQELDDCDYRGGHCKHYVDIFDYLLNVNEVIRNFGFWSKTRAEECGQDSTVSKVCFYMYSTSKYAQQERDRIGYNPSREENKKAVTEALEWIRGQETDGGYLHNLKMVCLKNHVEYRDCGLLASLLSAYFKHLETEKERAEREEKRAAMKFSRHIGNVGERMTFKVTIKKLTSFETDFGITRIYQLTDEAGNVFIWKTSTGIEETEQPITIKGTIKGHGEYNGVKQTELTRCKIA